MKKQILGLLAIIIAVSASAFTANHNNSHRAKPRTLATQTWYFNGNALSQAKTIGQYGSSPIKPCGDVVEVPCKIEFDADSYALPATNTPLQNYLNSMATVDDVLDDSITQRAH